MEYLTHCLVSGEAGSPTDTLWRLSDDELEQLVVSLDEHRNKTHAWLTHAIAEADERALPRRRHVLSTTQWIRQLLNTTKRRAGRLRKVAGTLRFLPNITKAMLAGEVGPEQASSLAAAQAKHPEAFAPHEESFASMARDLDHRDLCRAIEHWRQQVDHAKALQDCDSRRDLRRMSLHQTFDGMWRHDADYDPESGHVIAAAVTSHADPGNIDPDDRRIYGQRMVDSLVDICQFYLDHGTAAPTSGGEKPHITVTIGYDQLQPRHDVDAAPSLPDIDGSPVNPETIRRLACDAGVVRIVTDGASQPLDVGRRVRTVTPAIRRALDLRDGGCRWSGCDAPAGWTDAHHLVHWADGGETSLVNLVLLCRKHHTTVHDGNTTGLPREFMGRVAGHDPP